jgi:RNA polymerase sigma-70 factor (ECF subfamily)
MLREVEGLNTGETACNLGMSEDVVKTCLSRSRAAIRRDLFGRIAATAPQSFTFSRPRCDRVVAAVLARIG